MGVNNPFEVIIAITAFLLIGLSAFAIIAPSFVETTILPTQPEFPIFPNLNVQGNTEGGAYTFSQEGDIYLINAATTFWEYDAFVPDKQIEINTIGDFFVYRYGTDYAIPYWYKEPLSFLNGSLTPDYFRVNNALSAQTIVNNYNGTFSPFIVDNANKQYMAYLTFSPLSGYADMATSWNDGHGFHALLQSNTYAAPSWTDQAVSYLSFTGSVIGYILLYFAYIFQMAGLLFTVFGLAPELSAGIIIIIVTALIGSILMYIRGNSGGK